MLKPAVVSILILALTGIALGQLRPAVGLPGADPERTVALFIARSLFRDDVLNGLQRRLAHGGYDFAVVTRDSTLAVGMDRTVIKPNLVLADLRAEDFAGLVLVGGSGITTYWDDSLLQTRCREFDASGKLVGALGTAPIVLARAGVLRDRAATVYPDRTAVGYLKDGGASFRFRNVVVDGNVITGSSESELRPFAFAMTGWLDRRK